MIVKFEPSGTHFKGGVLKVRFDVYPEPLDLCYSHFYVDIFDRPPTEEEVADPDKLALIPTHKEVTPCHSHFVSIEPDELVNISSIVDGIFDNKTLVALDILSARDDRESRHMIAAMMKVKVRYPNRTTSYSQDINIRKVDKLDIPERARLKGILEESNNRLRGEVD